MARALGLALLLCTCVCARSNGEVHPPHSSPPHFTPLQPPTPRTHVVFATPQPTKISFPTPAQDITDCNAFSPNYGCAEWNLLDGAVNRHDCKVNGIMDWVSKPVRHAAYEVRADQTTYAPDSIVSIAVKVVQPGTLKPPSFSQTDR